MSFNNPSEFRGFANMSLNSKAVNETFLLAGSCKWRNNRLKFDFNFLKQTYPLSENPLSMLRETDIDFEMNDNIGTIRLKTIKQLNACYGLLFSNLIDGRKMLDISFVLYASDSPYARTFDFEPEDFRYPEIPSSISQSSSILSRIYKSISRTSPKETETSLQGFFTLELDVPLFEELMFPIRGRCSVEGTELNLFFPNHDMSAELPVIPMERKESFTFDIKHSRSTIQVYVKYFSETNVFLGRGWLTETDELCMLICFYGSNTKLDVLPQSLIS